MEQRLQGHLKKQSSSNAKLWNVRFFQQEGPQRINIFSKDVLKVLGVCFLLFFVFFCRCCALSLFSSLAVACFRSLVCQGTIDIARIQEVARFANGTFSIRTNERVYVLAPASDEKSSVSVILFSVSFF